MDYIFRFCQENELEQISAIQRKWTVVDISLADKEKGFLSRECYSNDDIANLISSGEIVVTIFDHKIIGYYINDNSSSQTEEYQHAIEEMKKEGKIPFESRVSLRTQIVIEEEHQRKGLPKKMLGFAQTELSKKYDLLFSIGINENPKRIAHEKAGWEIIFEDVKKYYCVYNLSSSSR